MRKLVICLLAPAVTFAVTGAAPAAPVPAALVCKAAAQASMVAKVHCRVVRRCSAFGCSYEEVCN